MTTCNAPLPYVWVTKTPETWKTRTAQEAFAIHSFVNGHYARWKRQDEFHRLGVKFLPYAHSESQVRLDSPRQTQEAVPTKCTEEDHSLPYDQQMT